MALNGVEMWDDLCGIVASKVSSSVHADTNPTVAPYYIIHARLYFYSLCFCVYRAVCLATSGSSEAETSYTLSHILQSLCDTDTQKPPNI